MPRWTLAPDGRHLLRDGVDDFLLADTLWAALYRSDPRGLAAVVEQRREQGFNACLLSLLPIANDHSGDVPDVVERATDGTVALTAAAVASCHERLRLVARAGLTPILVLTWVSWLPGTWAGGAPFELAQPDALALARQAVCEFARYEPLWCLSGDDLMTSPPAVATYEAMATLVRRLEPGALVLAHTGAFPNVPQSLLEAVDVVGFQSGHDEATWRSQPRAWTRYLARRRPRRAAINLEPPYEGHGYGQGRGRHDVAHVRLASWTSVLTGAGAGLGYGAHGLWNWHRTGDSFSSVAWSSQPFDALDALRLPGADDMGWLRELALALRLWELDDRTEVIVGNTSGAVAGGTDDLTRVVVYAPEPEELTLFGVGGRVTGWSVADRAPCRVDHASEGRHLRVGMPHETGPHLYAVERA